MGFGFLLEETYIAECAEGDGGLALDSSWPTNVSEEIKREGYCYLSIVVPKRF